MLLLYNVINRLTLVDYHKHKSDSISMNNFLCNDFDFEKINHKLPFVDSTTYFIKKNTA